MEARWRCGIIRMADEVRSEDSGGRARWQRYGTKGMNRVVEKMWDSNRRDVGRRRWVNGLEERQRTKQVSTGNNYQP